jgi:hypothetical protein
MAGFTVTTEAEGHLLHGRQTMEMIQPARTASAAAELKIRLNLPLEMVVVRNVPQDLYEATDWPEILEAARQVFMEGKWPEGESEGSDKLPLSILKWWYVGPDGLPQLEIDGNNFSTVEGFWEEFQRNVLGCTEELMMTYGPDSFDDSLRGDFGTPEGGFVLCWKNHEISRQTLGYPETVRHLTLRLRQHHPNPWLEERLEDAKRGIGPTLFDEIVDIISSHSGDKENPIDLKLL